MQKTLSGILVSEKQNYWQWANFFLLLVPYIHLSL